MVIESPTTIILLRTDSSGVICVGNTRVTFETVIEEFKRGESPESIAENFSAISLSQVYAIIAFYLSHTEDAEAYLAMRASEAARVRQAITSTTTYQQWRKRLLERRASRQA
ncbi:MAG: DUF433 domain-containing protein [Anaerolineae bacterium]|nr:DUF433 domain-containing protein [Anaerolineae bacterium]